VALAFPFLIAASCGEEDEGALEDGAEPFYTACTDATTFAQVTVDEARCMCRAERQMGFGAIESCLDAEQMMNLESACESDLFLGYTTSCALRLDEWNVCRERLLAFDSCEAAENYLADNIDGCGDVSRELTGCVVLPTLQ
jgi:hypothetical protein